MFDKIKQKIKDYSKILSKSISQKILTLILCIKDTNTPKFAKAIIFGCLSYFLFPLDMLPDIIPIIGFSDDITAIISTIAILKIYIKESHLKSAHVITKKIFLE